jgi:hypothetical protein
MTGPLAAQQPDIMMEVPRYEDVRGGKHAGIKRWIACSPTGDQDRAA